MAGVNYSFSFNAGSMLGGVYEYLNANIANVSLAVQLLAESGAARWKSEIMHARLWEGEKTAYVGSVQWHMTGDYSAEVWSDYKHAAEIETGRPARDLKEMLNTSDKVRVSSKGKRYLIIPFRHNTPGHNALAGDMSPEIYALAKALKPSRIVGEGTRPSGHGAWSIKTRQPVAVKSRKYLWGGSLPEGLTPKLAAHHATDPTAGMVKMNTSAGKKKSSAYMTFRVMVEGSPKWIVPAKPGLSLVPNVLSSLQPIVTEVFTKLREG